MLRKLRSVSCLLLALASSWNLARAVPITGKVVTPEGKPVASAQVFVRNNIFEAQPVSLTTDANGLFKADLPPMPNDTAAFGEAMAYVPNFALSGTTLAQGENVIKLEPADQLQGLVKDADGQPVAGAIIKLRYLNRNPLQQRHFISIAIPDTLSNQFTAKSGADGKWIIHNVPSQATASIWLDDPRFTHQYAQVKPTAAAEATTLTVQSGANVAGRVVDEKGQPVAGIKVAGSEQNNSSEATTAADGTYTLASLGAGTVELAVYDPAQQKVAPALENIRVKAGETTKADDFVLTAGTLVEGTVTDQADGKPLAGVRVTGFGAHQPMSGAGRHVVPTDQHGHYSLRVLPGKISITIWGQPATYMPLEKVIEIEARLGEINHVPIQLSRGMSVTGTAIDAAGNPVMGANFRAALDWRANQGGSYIQPADALADKNGQWTLDGLKAGLWNLNGLDEWEVVSPKQVTFPLTAPLKVTVHKLQLLNVVGHTLTKDHKPLAGVKIKAVIQVPEDGNSWRAETQEVTSDAQGQFTLEKLRPAAKISLSPAIAGYKYVSGGKVTSQANGFTTQDLVLVPLTAKIEGRTQDAAGNPVAGAKIMSPDGDTHLQATTDATGKFVLTSLPEGKVMVVAGHATLIGEARDTDGQKLLTLTLAPVKPPVSNDIQRAYNLLDDLWATTEGDPPYRANIPVTLAGYDPDLAVKLVARQDGTLNEGILGQIIIKLAQADPVRAAAWAPAKLPQIHDANMLFATRTALASAVAGVKPDLARDLYNQAKVYAQEQAVKDAQNPPPLASRGITLSKVARKLGLNAEADQWTQTAVAAIKTIKGDERQWMLTALAEVDYDETVKMMDELPESQRRQQIQQAVSSIAPTDTKLARRWLDKLIAVEKANPNNGSYASGATQSLVQALGKTDPAGALALARSVTDDYNKSICLAIAAQFQPPAIALTALREAGDMATATSYASVDTIARIAALTYDLDPKLGVALFAQAKDRWDSQQAQREDQEMYGGYNNAAAFAYYYSRFDPAASRLLIESEFARELQKPKADNNDIWQRGWQMRALVEAMASIDVDRAVELSYLLPPPDKDNQWNNPQVEAQRAIAQYILLSTAARRSKAFQQWGSD